MPFGDWRNVSRNAGCYGRAEKPFRAAAGSPGSGLSYMQTTNDHIETDQSGAFTVLGNRFGASGLRVHGAGAARSASSGQGCYPWDHSDGPRRVTRRPFASVLPVIARMANGHGFQQGNRAGSGSWPLHFWRRSARKISACRLRMRSISSRSICPAVGEYRSPHPIADE